ncbi:Hexaprenyldihydroxybenzoate methyltransferase, mitochondrial-like protein [Gossypium australe]|uniref:Hexaprenyldihydroxybenzoate methyltransferase, mitochondrial-like protein n=1 Tax=Gossypium australe TaxID=47621 RepID=A0A5B6VMF3_9ROSI|nr:Hexaprenyldihydroxybenzoate methyltransferase, mitochondrial-like protein [Gossypium australe]
MRNNPVAQQPPPPVVPPVIPPPYPMVETSRRASINKVRKYGVEEFRGRIEDDPAKAEYCKYAREIMLNEEEMCIRFEDGLNDEIKMMIGRTEIRQLVFLSDWAQKMEEIYNHKRQREKKA